MDTHLHQHKTSPLWLAPPLAPPSSFYECLAPPSPFAREAGHPHRNQPAFVAAPELVIQETTKFHRTECSNTFMILQSM